MKAQIDPGSLAQTFWAAVAAYVVVTAVFFAVVKLAGLEGSTYLHPLIFGNTGNLGLPLALFAFGEEGLSLAVVIFAVMIVYSVSLGLWMVSGRGSLGLGQVETSVLILQVATPVAVTSYPLAEKYGADPETVAGLVVVSTAVSVVSIPLTLAFLV